MKKTIITVAVVVLIAAFGWLAYDLRRKGKAFGPGTKGTVPLPPAATPPIQLTNTTGGTAAATDGPAPGLFYTDKGAGGLAVTKRMGEIRQAGLVQSEIVPALNPTTAMFAGMQYVSGPVSDFIALSTKGAGAENVPFLLTTKMRAAITPLATLSRTGSGFWKALEKLVNTATTIKEATGVAILGEDMYNPKDLNNLRNMTSLYAARDLKEPRSAGASTKAVERTLSDYNRLAQNWLTLADQTETALRERAIQDLRTTGWRFGGYDAPA